MTSVLLVGHGAREHAIAEAFSRCGHQVYSFLKSRNPGIISLSKGFEIGIYDFSALSKFAQKTKPDFVFVGPEDPLEKGIVDDFQKIGIECIGPTKTLAQLEASKSFTRKLLTKYKIEGNPTYRIFDKRTQDEIPDFIEKLGPCVIKPDGLTGEME